MTNRKPTKSSPQRANPSPKPHRIPPAQRLTISNLKHAQRVLFHCSPLTKSVTLATPCKRVQATPND
ncbi:hypothetical protein RO21_11300 [[Actinobacillus] muris]|uniref:Uncharacterized protein n=1 Tax=Muribacter muris TaxID=67855 RepID=A0A0J5P4Y0_9PAST|nr:hypothetical protein RO21_11300 [[Actinobacillus] muris] [Muribacter muris]